VAHRREVIIRQSEAALRGARNTEMPADLQDAVADPIADRGATN
jgi:hypothetical protein